MLEKRFGKGKVIIVTFLVLVTSTILLGCEFTEVSEKTHKPEDEERYGETTEIVYETEINVATEQEQSISEYKNEIQSLQVQTEFLSEQNQYLVSVIKELIKDFSEEEMLELSKSQFIYELQINGEPIPNNGHVTIPTGNVEISLVQRGMGYNFLPPEWIEKGMISENYMDHILNFDTTDWTPTGLDGTVNTAQGYMKTDAGSGDKYTFNITDELKERLKFETNNIQIEVE